MSTVAPSGNITDKKGDWDYESAVKAFGDLAGKLDNLMSIIKEVNVKLDEAAKARKKAALQAKLYRLQKLRASAPISHSDPGIPQKLKREEAPIKSEEEEAREELRKMEEEEGRRKKEEEEAGKRKVKLEELRSKIEAASQHVEETRAKREASANVAAGKGSLGAVKEEAPSGTVIGANGQAAPEYYKELLNMKSRYQAMGLLSSN